MGSGKDSSAHLSTLLHPFEERAQLAEERLAKLEFMIRRRKDSPVQADLLGSLTELRKKLVNVKAEQDAEKKKMTDENKKLQYQILHLKRAVAEADAKLAAAEAKSVRGS